MAKNRPNQFKGVATVTETSTAAEQEAQTQETSLETQQTGENTTGAEDTQAPSQSAAEQGEPQATEAPASTEAPVATQVPATSEAPAAEDAQAQLQERLSSDLTKTEMIVRDTIEQYLEELKPGRPVQPEVINRNQQILWRLIVRVFQAEDDLDFEKSLTLLVAYFRAHRKGALGEYHVFRGMDTITMDQDTIAAFQRALNLLIICATVGSLKEAGRHADLARSLPEGVYSDNARNRLLGFLS